MSRRHPLLIGFVLLLFAAGLYAVIVAREVLLLAFISVVLASLLSFPVSLFEQFFSRGISVLCTLMLVIVIFIGMTSLTVPLVSTEVKELRRQLPQAAEKLKEWVSIAKESASEITTSSGAEPEISHEGATAPANVLPPVGRIAAKVIPFAVNLVGLFSTAFLVFVLAVFLLYEAPDYRAAFLALIPSEHQGVWVEALTRLTTVLRRWVGGIFLSMTLMGTFAGLGLWLAGIQGAFTLGLLTFFGTFVPYLGAIASSIPGMLMGLSQSPRQLIYAAIVYLGVHLFEGYLISPWIMRHAVTLKPGLLLIWEAAMGALFGITGIIVATPLLACLKVSLEYFYLERRLGRSHDPGQ
jgi:predicted PurR-regulated permease PerM